MGSLYSCQVKANSIERASYRREDAGIALYNRFLPPPPRFSAADTFRANLQCRAKRVIRSPADHGKLYLQKRGGRDGND